MRPALKDDIALAMAQSIARTVWVVQVNHGFAAFDAQGNTVGRARYKATLEHDLRLRSEELGIYAIASVVYPWKRRGRLTSPEVDKVRKMIEGLVLPPEDQP